MIVGDGDFKYELADEWEQLPEGWSHGDVAGVATDSQDRVYVFNRGDHPLIIYNRDGHFLGSWGEGVFTRAHGITVCGDEIYAVDDADHSVRRFTLDGTLLQTLGTPGVPSETGYSGAGPGSLRTIEHAAGPFNRPTRLSMAPNGDLFVSDGYGNARVHHFNAKGELIASWGGPGSGAGQFNLPHSVWVHHDGRVFVCDRENDRIQIFSPEGECLDTWTNVTRPGDLFIDEQDNVYIGEMYWENGVMSLSGRIWPEERISKMTVRTLEGEIISSFGGEVGGGDPRLPGNLTSPHGIWVDAHHDIYVAEVSKTSYRGAIYSPGCHTLQKFIRVR